MDPKDREALRKMHEKMRKDRVRKSEDNSYSDIGSKRNIIRSDSKNLKVTFAVIEKMHYSDFNSGKNAVDDFKPSDIIDDEDNNYTDDEILNKFKKDLPAASSGAKVNPNQSKVMTTDETDVSQAAPYSNRRSGNNVRIEN